MWPLPVTGGISLDLFTLTVPEKFLGFASQLRRETRAAGAAAPAAGPPKALPPRQTSIAPPVLPPTRQNRHQSTSRSIDPESPMDVIS